MNIIISGCTGRMGQTVEKLLKEENNIKITCGFGLNTENLKLQYPIYEKASQCELKTDVVIDFSNTNCLDDVLSYCTKNKTALVLATTGLGEEEFKKVMKATEIIPIFQSYNMSLGIGLLKDLIKKATKTIGNQADIEIIEKHHNKKVDAPSGTAHVLANTIKENLEKPAEYIYGRHGNNSKRTPNEIGIHAIRGGTIVGEHTVIFATNGEVLEITHRAESKELFASGAINAAKFIISKPAGIYNMDDLVSA